MTRSIATSLAALAALLLLAGGAGAQGCLEGGAALGDQRDLRALAAATESACPCASAASRSAYRSCAKDVLDDAMGHGDLRGICKQTATRAFKDSTCGTDRVACGQYKASSSSHPLDCKIKPVASCHDTSKLDTNVCTEETHCSEVVDATATTCLRPNDPGPYAETQRQFHWVKPSVVNPQQDRVLDTWVTYPTTGVGSPAAVDPSGAPYPVVLFSHGSCGFPNQSTFLTERIASYGYIVVAPPHPGNTIGDANCGSFQSQVASVQERPQDMVFVLDQILAENENPGSAFFGMVDPDRIVMSGHSFGGLTTYLTQSIEPRITAAIPLAPAASNGSKLTVPSLSMLGEIDSTVDNEKIRDAYNRSTSPKILVGIADAGHYAFSNGCFPGPDCNPPVTMTQDEAHEVVLRWVIPFLERRVRGDAAWAPFLLPGSYPVFSAQSVG